MLAFFKRSPVTSVLLGLTLLVFLSMQLLFRGESTSAYAVFLAGGMYGEVIKADPSQAWRLITPILVHIGWQHLLLNGLTLYFVGQLAERLFGSLRFLCLYLFSGIMGNLFTLLFRPMVIAAGASTALFGLFAALSLLGYFGHHPYLKQIGKNYQLLLAMNLFFNLFSPDVGMAGHIGGLVGGLLVGVLVANHVEHGLFSRQLQLQAVLAYLTISLIFIVLAL